MYEEKCDEVAEMLKQKSESYGATYEKAGEFLRLIFPEGIPPEKFDDAIIMVRVFDVLMRKANGNYENGWKYIAGYGILGMEQE